MLQALIDMAHQSLFNEVLRLYPYREALKSLQAQHIPFADLGHSVSSSAASKTLLSLAGATIRSGTIELKHNLITTIRQFIVSESVPTLRPIPAQQAGSRQEGLQESEDMAVPSFDNEPVSGISRYTAQLKERGDQVGSCPKYDILRTSTTTQPPRFQAIVFFQERRFEGRGKSKQQAKHQASKAACDYLDI